jgi:hypothetical protein
MSQISIHSSTTFEIDGTGYDIDDKHLSKSDLVFLARNLISLNVYSNLKSHVQHVQELMSKLDGKTCLHSDGVTAHDLRCSMRKLLLAWWKPLDPIARSNVGLLTGESNAPTVETEATHKMHVIGTFGQHNNVITMKNKYNGVIEEASKATEEFEMAAAKLAQCQTNLKQTTWNLKNKVLESSGSQSEGRSKMNKYMEEIKKLENANSDLEKTLQEVRRERASFKDDKLKSSQDLMMSRKEQLECVTQKKELTSNLEKCAEGLEMVQGREQVTEGVRMQTQVNVEGLTALLARAQESLESCRSDRVNWE